MFTLALKRGVGQINTSLAEFYYPPSDDPRFTITSGSFDQEINGAGSLTFTIPHMNVVYDEIDEMHSEIVLKYDGVEYWRGRVISSEVDYYKNKTITCEGLLNYLLDSYISPKELAAIPTPNGGPIYEGSTASVGDMFIAYIDSHNNKVDISGEETRGYKKFTVVISELRADWGVRSNGDTTIKEYLTIGADEYPTTLDQIMDDLIEQNGGFLWVDGGTNLIHYRKNLSQAPADQYISFGENMIDYTCGINTEDDEGFYTALIPLGKSQDTSNSGHSTRLDISGATSWDGRIYLKKTDLPNYTGQDIPSEYGMIFHVETFDDIETADKLKEEGLKFLADHVNLPQTYTIRAVDRSFYSGASPLKVGMKVHVMSAPHGISRDDMVLSAVSIDLVNPANSEYTFGDPRSILTKKQWEAAKTALAAQKKAQTAQASATNANKALSTVSLAIATGENETVELVNAAFNNGYYTIVGDDDDNEGGT